MTRWALLMPSGHVEVGAGRPDHFQGIARAAVGALFTNGRGQVLIVVGAANVEWTCERDAVTHAEGAIYWGLAPPPGARVWLGPNGTIGIGKCIEDVERVAAALRSRLER